MNEAADIAAESGGLGLGQAGIGAVNGQAAVGFDGSSPTAAAVGRGASPADGSLNLNGSTMPPIRDAVFRRLLAVADLIAAAGAVTILGVITGRGVGGATLASVPLIVLIAKVAGRYDYDEVVLRKSTIDEIPALLGLAATYALVWSLVAFLADVHMDLGGSGVVMLWGSTACLLIVGRACARKLAQASAPPERAVIVGNSRARTMLSHSLECDPVARVEVVGFLSLEDDEYEGSEVLSKPADSLNDLETLVTESGAERVFLVPSGADSETLREAVTRTSAMGVKLSIVPRLFEVVGSAVEFDVVGGVTVLGVRRPGLGRSSLAIKRVIDFVGAAVGLLLLAPLGALVAVAIKLDSPGPVFFRQPRIGRRGKRFHIIKFRSMVDGAEAQRAALAALNESDGIFKLSADPRVTRVGRWLRRSSLDELPQLINVLKGEMSLVGPRPLIVDEDVLIEGRHRDRLQFAPGMTGMWQVLGPSRPPLSEMVKLDYLYAANWSLWTDIKILLRTFSHVIGQRGV